MYDRLSRNVGKELPLRYIPEERRSHVHRGGSLKPSIPRGSCYQLSLGHNEYMTGREVRDVSRRGSNRFLQDDGPCDVFP
jgi:hypothetical protein